MPEAWDTEHREFGSVRVMRMHGRDMHLTWHLEGVDITIPRHQKRSGWMKGVDYASHKDKDIVYS